VDKTNKKKYIRNLNVSHKYANHLNIEMKAHPIIFMKKTHISFYNFVLNFEIFCYFKLLFDYRYGYFVNEHSLGLHHPPPHTPLSLTYVSLACISFNPNAM
jgi:hypothetical protein